LLIELNGDAGTAQLRQHRIEVAVEFFEREFS
jgi:hypothetical protein